MMGIDESKQFIPVRIAVLTVSDTRSVDDDTSGDLLTARIEKTGHVLAARKIVRDTAKDIACLLYTSPSPRDLSTSRMPSSA